MTADGADPQARRRALEIALDARDLHSNPDATTLTLVARLGAITAEIGNRHEARRHFRHVAERGPAVLGADHPVVRRANAYLSGAPAEAGSVIRVTPIPRAPAAARVPLEGRADPRTRKRLIVAVAAVLVVLAVTGGVLAYRAAQPEQPGPRLPSAPTHVTAVTDAGNTTVTWADPSDGRVSFVVSGGTNGAPPKIVRQVPAGQTSVVLTDSAPSGYCFTVAAVYATDLVAISKPVCS